LHKVVVVGWVRFFGTAKKRNPTNGPRFTHKVVVVGWVRFFGTAKKRNPLKTPEKRESKNKNMFFSMLSSFGTLVLLKSQCTTTITD